MTERLWGILTDSFPIMLEYGIKVTIPLTILSFALALTVALGVALVQYAKVKGIRQICRFYIWITRGTPLLVQLYIVFYGLPKIGIVLDAFPSAVIVLGLNEAAYMAETIRGTLESVSAGQLEAGYCVGMSWPKIMWHVVLPQAFQNVLPEMANTFLTNLKMTSVLNVIAVQELFMAAKTVGGNYYKYFESYLVIAVIYFVLCFVFNQLFLLMERNMRDTDDYALAVEYLESD